MRVRGVARISETELKLAQAMPIYSAKAVTAGEAQASDKSGSGDATGPEASKDDAR